MGGMDGKVFAAKRGERTIRIIGRCQPREYQWCPVVWTAVNVKTGRTTYIADATLLKTYREVTT